VGLDQLPLVANGTGTLAQPEAWVSPTAGNVRIIVLRSGRAGLDAWQAEQRNVAADYLALFGRAPPRVGQVALMIDTNDTRGEAEALFGDLVFSRTPGGRTESPTSMLR